MTFIVTEACIKCKYTDCVVVCPVDCFLEGPNMLVIDPDQCIDCGVCVPECPAEAIVPDNSDSPDLGHWANVNRQLAQVYAPIRARHDPLPDADAWNPLINPETPSKKNMI
jgi:ferredoxin